MERSADATIPSPWKWPAGVFIACKGTGMAQSTRAFKGYNPFVLVHYSPTICLNPRLLIFWSKVLADFGRSRKEM
jgi:hypothetical protein